MAVFNVEQIFSAGREFSDERWCGFSTPLPAEFELVTDGFGMLVSGFSALASGLEVISLLTVGLDFEKCDVQLRCFSINSLLLSLRSGFSGLELLSYLVTTTPFTFGSELDRYFSVSPEVADPFTTLTPFGTAFFEYTAPFTWFRFFGDGDLGDINDSVLA